MVLVSDDFDRSDGALVGSQLSNAPLNWLTGSGAPTVVAGSIGGSGFAVVDLHDSDAPTSVYLKQGGRLVFRYADANNYWYVNASTYSGNNADTPPIVSTGYRFQVFRVIGGSAGLVREFDGAVEQMQYPNYPPAFHGEVSGTMDVFRRVSVVLAGNTINVSAVTGGPGSATTTPTTTSASTITDGSHATATRFGVGGPADNWQGQLAYLTPYVPALML